MLTNVQVFGEYGAIILGLSKVNSSIVSSRKDHFKNHFRQKLETGTTVFNGDNIVERTIQCKSFEKIFKLILVKF